MNTYITACIPVWHAYSYTCTLSLYCVGIRRWMRPSCSKEGIGDSQGSSFGKWLMTLGHGGRQKPDGRVCAILWCLRFGHWTIFFFFFFRACLLKGINTDSSAHHCLYYDHVCVHACILKTRWDALEKFKRWHFHDNSFRSSFALELWRSKVRGLLSGKCDRYEVRNCKF